MASTINSCNLSLSKEITLFIIDKINNLENSNNLEEKINITAFIINNHSKINNLFYIEECQNSLLKWLYDNKENFNKNYIYYPQLIDLLYNIIIIFETFPIQSETLIDCKFIQKLNIINSFVYSQNLALGKRINILIDYWNNFIQKVKINKNINNSNKNNNKILGNKVNRNFFDEDFNINKEDNNNKKKENNNNNENNENIIENNKNINNDNNNSSFNNKKKLEIDTDSIGECDTCENSTKSSKKKIEFNINNNKKKLKWKENLVEIEYINTDEEPIKKY